MFVSELQHLENLSDLDAGASAMSSFSLLTNLVLPIFISGIFTLFINMLDRTKPNWEPQISDPVWGIDMVGDLQGPSVEVRVVNTGAAPAYRVRVLGFYCGKRENLVEGYKITTPLEPYLNPGDSISGHYEVHSVHWDDAGILVAWTQPGFPRRRMAHKYQFIKLTDWVDKPITEEQFVYEINSGEYGLDAYLIDLDENQTQWQGNRDDWLLSQKQVFIRKNSKRRDRKEWRKISKSPWSKVQQDR
ncbi:hypothetical protein A6F49_14530 [Enteractinococcus helveticum]|uniref:Uncharacterized protein n=1 Tax=Enteractinococcus helveticum TaxID=1837282 RepID=A0A1B7LXP9_9MICC|nr:hypothetical protein A6F49_14530 [Enteractinococcus helveticum]